jgi:hypothetical protein
MGLDRGLLSLVSTIEELLERKRSGSDLEIREYGHRDPSRWPRGTLYPQKVALNSPTIGGRSVGIVLSGTQTTEFSLVGEKWEFIETVHQLFIDNAYDPIKSGVLNNI